MGRDASVGSRWASLFVLAVLLLLVGGAASAGGSVNDWAAEWLRFGAILCLGALLWFLPIKRVFARPAATLLLPAAAFVLWGFAQTVPLPGGVLRAVSPRAAEIYADTVPPGGGASLPGWLLDRARADGVEIGRRGNAPPATPDPGDPRVGRTISVNPSLTWETCFLVITSILLFATAACLSAGRMLRYRLLWGVSLWTGALGFAGLIHRIGGIDLFSWFRTLPQDSLPMGPFVNPNHFAGFVAMGTLAALGLAFAIVEHSGGGLDRDGIRAALLDRGWGLPRLIILSAALLLSLASLVVSRSLGGWLGFGAGLAFFLVARMRGRRRLVAAAVVALVLLGFGVGVAGWLGVRGTEQSIGSSPLGQADPSAVMRVEIWGKTVEMFQDFPWVGSGLGTFDLALAAYHGAGEWMSWQHAHNDYLELLAEAGLVGLAILAWAVFILVTRVYLPALGGPERRPRWSTVGIAAAVFAMLAHSVVDFNLKIPSNAALFAVLLGVLAAAAGDEGRTARPESTTP